MDRSFIWSAMNTLQTFSDSAENYDLYLSARDRQIAERTRQGELNMARRQLLEERAAKEAALVAEARERVAKEKERAAKEAALSEVEKLRALLAQKNASS